MSQTELAETLEARGLPWTQNTVTTVEHDKRDLKFSEAVAISDELGVSLDWLAGRGSVTEDELRAWAVRAEDRLQRAWQALSEVVGESDPLAPRWGR